MRIIERVVTLCELQKGVAEWARAALPPEADHLKKLKEEMGELLESPCDAEEMADVCLALMLHAEKCGVDLLSAARAKLGAIRARAYGPCDENGVSRHL